MNSYYVWPQLRYVGLNTSLKLPRPLEDNLNLLPGPLAPTPASASFSTHRESSVYFNWLLSPCLASTFFPDKNLSDISSNSAEGVSEPYRKSSSWFPVVIMLVVMKSGIWLPGWQNIIRAHKYVGGGGEGEGRGCYSQGWELLGHISVSCGYPDWSSHFPPPPHTFLRENIMSPVRKTRKNISHEHFCWNVCWYRIGPMW